jgi:hypothetical protein
MGHGRELRDLKAWQKSHAGKPLYELQIEICRSGLKKVQDNNYFTPAQRKELARNVEKMIARLSADKKALVCDRWGGGESYHFIVGADAAKKYREMAEGAAPPGKD